MNLTQCNWYNKLYEPKIHSMLAVYQLQHTSTILIVVAMLCLVGRVRFHECFTYFKEIKIIKKCLKIFTTLVKIRHVHNLINATQQ